MKKTYGLILITLGIIILLSAAIWGGLLAALPDLAGFKGERKYLILLQNQMELRPTGGFLGSYAVAAVKNGKLVNLSVQDIYEPDGRVTEHVDPPAPIQEAFQLGTLRLRDANWDPDFHQTAKTLQWYFRQAGEGEFDGVIAANLLVFQEILGLTGPIKLVDYAENITADNLWEKAQFYSQQNFFPGSKQKREFLGDLSKTIRNRLETSSLREKIRLTQLIIKLLVQKQIMIYSADEPIQSAMDAAGWSGEVKTAACPAWLANCVSDSLIVIEANLGVNKANCCLETNARLELNKQENSWHHKLILNYENRSGDSPWGGKYKAWIKVLIPSSAGGEKSFWADVPAGEKRQYSVEYDLPIESGKSSSPLFLLIQKQSGISGWPLELSFKQNGREKIDKLLIKKDTTLILR